MNIDQDRTFNIVVIAVAALLFVVGMIQFAMADTTIYLVSSDTLYNGAIWPALAILYPANVQHWIWASGDTQAICRWYGPDTYAEIISAERITDSEIINNRPSLPVVGDIRTLFSN